MSSGDDPIAQPHPHPIPTHPRALKWRRFLLWAPAISALFLAIFLQIAHPLKPSFLPRLLHLLSPPQHQGDTNPTTPSARTPCVPWMAPFLSGGGYSSEAWSYITSLNGTIRDHSLTIKIDHHGDQESIDFWNGLADDTKLLAYNLYAADCPLKDAIVICHSEPGAWYPPLFQTLPCPPTGYGEPLYVIGRTMFETDRLTPEHVRRCNRMDSVWVPTDFHVSMFVQSGVEPSKVVKVVQPVDVDFFDPAKQQAVFLPDRSPVLGTSAKTKEFVFLSVFKWEHRKGWDVLLKSYLEEFSGSDGVALCLLVSAYHSDAEFGRKIVDFVEQCDLKEPANGWAPIYVIDRHVPQIELPGMYKAANAFVLPTRGEGWGRPIVEAMAMGLPVIATNWSGPTEYLTEENGYPLQVDRMSEVVEGPFKGHLWAEPLGDQLRALMRRVVSNPEEGKERGRRAREDMIQRFAPQVVARILVDEFLRISKN